MKYIKGRNKQKNQKQRSKGEAGKGQLDESTWATTEMRQNKPDISVIFIRGKKDVPLHFPSIQFFLCVCVRRENYFQHLQLFSTYNSF